MCGIIIGVWLSMMLCYSVLGIAEGYSSGNTNAMLVSAIPIAALLVLWGIYSYLTRQK